MPDMVRTGIGVERDVGPKVFQCSNRWGLREKAAGSGGEYG